MKERFNAQTSVIRSFLRIYEKRKTITLEEALSVIMEEILSDKTKVTPEMVQKARKALDLQKRISR